MRRVFKMFKICLEKKTSQSSLQRWKRPLVNIVLQSCTTLTKSLLEFLFLSVLTRM